jgi:DNA-binding MarR family transcriptional regulator
MSKFLKVEDDLFEKGLTANEVLILAKVRQFTENKHDCYMTNQQFADWLNVSKPTIDNALNKLEKLGFITRNTNVVSDFGKVTRQRVIVLGDIKKQTDTKKPEASKKQTCSQVVERKFSGFSF